MVNDLISDMLTRIRNGIIARHQSVMFPASKMTIEIARIMQAERFIKNYEVIKDGPGRMVRAALIYKGHNESAILGLTRVSKPGLRVYSPSTRIPSVYGGLGVAIMSTSKGLMTGKAARRNRLGGEVLCYVW